MLGLGIHRNQTSVLNNVVADASAATETAARGMIVHMNAFAFRNSVRAAVVFVTILALAGCAQPDPRVAPDIRYRSKALAHTTERMQRSHEAREPNLRYTFSQIEKNVAQDAERTRTWPGKLKGYVDRDVQRWEENQEEYADQLIGVFDGQTDQIARNAVIMFY